MKIELCPDCNHVMKLVQVVDEKTAVMECNHCHKRETLTYEEKTFPSNINAFNWGAFALWPFWGLGNKMAYLLGIYFIIGFATIFLYFIPSIIGIIISIYLGIKGNRLSWENKDWKSVEQFEKSQKDWNLAGIIVLVIPVAIIFVLMSFV